MNKTLFEQVYSIWCRHIAASGRKPLSKEQALKDFQANLRQAKAFIQRGKWNRDHVFATWSETWELNEAQKAEFQAILGG